METNTSTSKSKIKSIRTNSISISITLLFGILFLIPFFIVINFVGNNFDASSLSSAKKLLYGFTLGLYSVIPFPIAAASIAKFNGNLYINSLKEIFSSVINTKDSQMISGLILGVICFIIAAILFLAVSINGIVNAIKSIFIKKTFAKVMAIIMLILFIALLGITSIVFSNWNVIVMHTSKNQFQFANKYAVYILPGLALVLFILSTIFNKAAKKWYEEESLKSSKSL